jgi:uncharacterized MAPEG superfamily protein
MVTPIESLVASAALTWVMLVTAALARTRALSLRGLVRAFGNREDLPGPAPFADRADRAARNMVENLVLFAVLLLAAALADVPPQDLALPSAIFVGARILYAPLYWGGVKYVRTLVWAASLVGLAWIGSAAALA